MGAFISAQLFVPTSETHFKNGDLAQAPLKNERTKLRSVALSIVKKAPKKVWLLFKSLMPTAALLSSL